MESTTYPNGITAYYAFDDNGNLADLDYRKSGTSVRRYQYGYDKNGMRMNMTDNDGVHDYTRKVYLKQGKVTMKNFQEIRTVLQEHAQELQDRYQISNLAVFGSMVRGEAREDSDVDIIADVPENMSLLGIISVENYLSDIVGMKVDFIPRSDIRQELRNHILDEAVAI